MKNYLNKFRNYQKKLEFFFKYNISNNINRLINSVNKEWDIKNLNYSLNCCSNLETNIDKIKEENKSLQNWVASKIYTIDYNPKEMK